jgi:hypothetical protein
MNFSKAGYIASSVVLACCEITNEIVTKVKINKLVILINGFLYVNQSITRVYIEKIFLHEKIFKDTK